MWERKSVWAYRILHMLTFFLYCMRCLLVKLWVCERFIRVYWVLLFLGCFCFPLLEGFDSFIVTYSRTLYIKVTSVYIFFLLVLIFILKSDYAVSKYQFYR